MRSEEVDEAIDTLQNCIADYVIGDFCVGEYCPMENECKDKDCPFNTAIDKVVAYISELEKDNVEWRAKWLKLLGEIDVIPKQMIRDKIKELEEMELDNNDIFGQMRNYATLILKDLLKGE